MTPKPEHRISALGKRVTHLEYTIEELSSDTAEELRVIRQHVDQGFDQAHAFVQERFSEINARFDKVEQRLDRIESTMATKEDLGKLEARLDKQNELLLQILQRLPKQSE